MYNKIYNKIHKNIKYIYIFLFVLLIMYLCNCSINEYIQEHLSNATKKVLNDNKIKKDIIKIKSDLAKIEPKKGTRGERGLRGPMGPPGKSGGTNIFSYRPLYHSKMGNDYVLQKGNSNDGVGKLFMTKKTKFGKTINWTLTSDNKLKSLDGACIYIKNKNLIASHKGCSNSKWIYTPGGKLVQKDDPNSFISVSENPNGDSDGDYDVILTDKKHITDDEMWQTWGI